MSRCGGLIPIGNQAFTALVDPVSPPSATAEPRSVPPLLVEAPGYCPPGPKCLFHLIVYRRSRFPGLANLGFSGVIFKKLTKSSRMRNRYGGGGLERV
jgi:hypothetical protein